MRFSSLMGARHDHLAMARHRIACQTAALTGLRRSEMANLERAHVRLDGERPQIVAKAATTKNKKQATIPLRRELGEALRAHLTSLAGGPAMRHKSGENARYRVRTWSRVVAWGTKRRGAVLRT
jgi:integrase